MRAKILIFPLVLLVVVVVAIWVIKPLLSEALAQNKDLGDKEKTLTQQQAKNRNIEKLLSELGSRSLDQQLIESFIPSNICEDEIVNHIDSLATNSELWVLNVAVKESEAAKKSVSTAESATNTAAAAATTVQGASNTAQPELANLFDKFKPKDMLVEATISGKYEKIKEFVNRLNTDSRFSNLQIAQISVPTNTNTSTSGSGTGETASQSTDILNATITFDFNYLPLVSNTTGISASFVTNGRYNDEVLGKIRDILQTPVPEISGGSAGKSNPFAKQ